MNGVHKVLRTFLHKFVSIISKHLPGGKNVSNERCRNNEGSDPATNIFFLQVLRFSRYLNERKGMHQNCAIPNLLVSVTESTSKHVITFDQWHKEQFILLCHQLSLFTLSASPSHLYLRIRRGFSIGHWNLRGNKQMKDGENYIMGNFTCIFNKLYQDDQIRKIWHK